MESTAIGLDALSDVEFLELIIRQFDSRPSPQLVLGIARDRNGNEVLLSTVGEPHPRELRDIANRLGSKDISWTKLVKKAD